MRNTMKEDSGYDFSETSVTCYIHVVYNYAYKIIHSVSTTHLFLQLPQQLL